MRVKVTLAYDGSDFDGWQKQHHGRTIQGELEKILKKIHKHDVKVVGSGRTDAGVHALGQVFHFDTDLMIPNDKWPLAINALCPDDLRIIKVQSVDETFHARYSAVQKTYQYQVNVGAYNLFQRKMVYQLNASVDLDLIQEAASLLIGTHDFTSFNATSHEEIEDQVRTIHAIDINQEGDIITFTLKGSGFLRYMVRMIVASLLEVGRHRLPINALSYALKHPDKRALNSNVPACGLTLISVHYELL
ncbi:hypothetical protein AOC36_03505 [Erysipelothrix larvae]|uniref:tRNA pseudouridine synthase A n=1 Tax=Erysipelothrix larvae TaxID=1514105 RepID=A0A120JTJ6_9FIRM|nr:tRNA pseudouridine(38-40) synthase TruA [Erysipelothrix larvae]AMC93075.1 hypothetical protein AOC36_03505 [Erysipelothrix larvae]